MLKVELPCKFHVAVFEKIRHGSHLWIVSRFFRFSSFLFCGDKREGIYKVQYTAMYQTCFTLPDKAEVFADRTDPVMFCQTYLGEFTTGMFRGVYYYK